MANELILIIEDNEVNRVLVRHMLRFKRYKTLGAQTAEEGIRVARESSLPDPDGLSSPEDECDRSVSSVARSSRDEIDH